MMVATDSNIQLQVRHPRRHPLHNAHLLQRADLLRHPEEAETEVGQVTILIEYRFLQQR
jgi:hypothetical protein